MTVVTIRARSDFTLANFERVAWRGHELRLADAAWTRIEAARAAFLEYLAGHPDEKIYGVTTGFGDRARRVLEPADRDSQATWPGYHRGIGHGDPYPPRVVRGMVFARLANFVGGESAVSPGLVRAVGDMLNRGPLPLVRSRGQLSSGEVNTLLELFGHLLGQDREVKDAASITNGSPCSSAMGADAAIRAGRRLRLVDQVMALAVMAAAIPWTPYDHRLADVWCDEGDRAALLGLSALLPPERAPAGQQTQPPVSWRVVPKIVGEAYRSAARLVVAAEAALASNSDNPVIVPGSAHSLAPGPAILPNGGFHNGAIYPALDSLGRAWADVGTLSGRHLVRLLKLIPDLARDSAAAAGREGMSLYGLTGIQPYFAREGREAAAPTFLLCEDTVNEQTDVLLPTAIAYDKELRAGAALSGCLACLAIAASECLWLRGEAVDGAVGNLLEEIRDACPPCGPLRNLGPDLERVSAVLERRVVAEQGAN